MVQTSTKAPAVDEPEFGAASILEDNENEDTNDKVKEDAVEEQLGTIPLWVWILGIDFSMIFIFSNFLKII